MLPAQTIEQVMLALTGDEVRALYRAAVSGRNDIEQRETDEDDEKAADALTAVIPRLASLGWTPDGEER